ncbi:MAG: hypothetical protein AAF598_17160 [Bacteroidota bacterium]
MSPTIKGHRYRTPQEKFKTHMKRVKIIGTALFILLVILVIRNWDDIWLTLQSWFT